MFCIEKKLSLITSKEKIENDNTTVRRDAIADGIKVRHVWCLFPLLNNPSAAPREKSAITVIKRDKFSDNMFSF